MTSSSATPSSPSRAVKEFGERVLLCMASPEALDALLPGARRLAHGQGGELCVVHVRVRGKDPDIERDGWHEDVSRRLEGLDVPWRLLWRDGEDAPSTILDTVNETRAEVLALTPERHAASERLLLGSVAEVLARRVRCTLLSVPVGFSGKSDSRARRALAVVVREEPQDGFLERAGRLADRFDLELELVELDETCPVHPSEPSRRWAPPIPPLDGASSVPPRPEAGPLVVLQKAGVDDVGLIIVGGREAEGADDGFIGTIQERFLRRSPCPVLVVPPADLPS